MTLLQVKFSVCHNNLVPISTTHHSACPCPAGLRAVEPTSSSPTVVLAVPAEHLPLLMLVPVCLNNRNQTTGTGTNWRVRAGTAAWHCSCGKHLAWVDSPQVELVLGSTAELGSCQKSYQAPNPPRGSCCMATSLYPGRSQPSRAGDTGTV